jgi:hypothetical protein
MTLSQKPIRMFVPLKKFDRQSDQNQPAWNIKNLIGMVDLVINIQTVSIQASRKNFFIIVKAGSTTIICTSIALLFHSEWLLSEANSYFLSSKDLRHSTKNLIVKWLQLKE